LTHKDDEAAEEQKLVSSGRMNDTCSRQSYHVRYTRHFLLRTCQQLIEKYHCIAGGQHSSSPPMQAPAKKERVDGLHKVTHTISIILAALFSLFQMSLS
jgi:hypothetical protein